MIVCQCKGTTDAAIRRAIRAGASTVGEVGAACLAGTECEGCHETILQLIRSEPDSTAEEKKPAPAIAAAPRMPASKGADHTSNP